MHISIIPIVKAFEALQSTFLDVKGNCARINTPLDQLALIRTNTRRRRNQDDAKPTRTTHPNIFKAGNICEISGKDLSVHNTVYTDSPTLKPDEELWTILGIDQLHFLRKAEILREIKKLFKNLIDGRDFTNDDEAPSLPEMFDKVKKGSQAYKKILLHTSNQIGAPRLKIEQDWKISEKEGMEKFFEKALSFWRTSCLPAKIQLLLLKICNHNLKLNNQLKHFALDERGVRVKPECTFCKISEPLTDTKESYRHFFIDCIHSREALDPIAAKYNIQLPDTTTHGESILYYHIQQGHWDELRTNIFLAIYKLFLTNCRTRKILPNSNHFEAVLKYECKNIILTNPTNKELVKNLLPLWTEHELSETETLELIEEVEGHTDKGKLFIKSNKNTIVVKAQLHLNMRFPIVSNEYQIHRLNEKKNNDLIRANLLSDNIPQPTNPDNQAIQPENQNQRNPQNHNQVVLPDDQNQIQPQNQNQAGLPAVQQL